MRDQLVRTLLAAVALGAAPATPAAAAPGGDDCGYRVDVACGWDPCHPEEGCVTRFCVVTVNRCLAQAEV